MLHQVDASVSKVTENIATQQSSIQHLNTQLSDNVSTSMEVCLCVRLSIRVSVSICVQTPNFLDKLIFSVLKYSIQKPTSLSNEK